MPTKLKVLIIEDRPADAELVLRELRRAGYEPEWKRVETEPDYLAQLDQGWEVILADFSLPQFTGLRALELLTESGLVIPFIIVSASIGEDMAVTATKAGLNDYVMKDNLVRLGPAVRRELAQAIVRGKRKQAEASLRESEDRFRRVVDVTEEGIWEWDISTNREFVSPRWCEIVGYSFDDPELPHAYNSWAERIHPDDSERVAGALKNHLEKGAKYDVDYRHRHKSGEYRWQNSRGQALRDKSGKPTNMVGCIADITERKRAETALRESHELLSLFVKRSPVYAFIKESTPGRSRVLVASENFADLTGVPGSQMTGKTMEDLFPPEFAAKITADDWAVASGGKTLQLDEILGNRHFTTIKFPIVLGDKNLMAGYTIDITERKRAEEALLVSEERYRTLFDGSNDGIALADATTGTIIDCNLTLCCMVERDKAEIRGQSQSILHPPQPLVDGQSPTFRQHRAGHTDQSLEDILLSKSGKLIPVEIRAAHVTIGGGPFILGIFRDITERNRAMAEQATLQAQLNQAQKMESVGRLAGGVAHDFNNLLTVILGYAETLQRALKEGDPHRKPVDEIRLAAKRAAGLTRQLLAFSRRQILEPRVLDLGDVVRSLEPMLRRLIGEDLDLRIACPEGLGRVKADPGQIEQVLMNLAVNARDAMAGGGKLTIDASNVDLCDDYTSRRMEFKPGPYVVLAVTDTGTGMTPEVQQRLFEPFFTTKEQGKGTGLGLSTVFGIVKQSGGHIAVYSEVGRGTTFKIHLPRVEEAARPITHARMPAVLPRGTETILVAEDEEGVRQLVRMVLMDGGYTVIEASNGEQALHLCERHAGPLHLLISDVIMPQMGGKQLAEHLRKLRPNLKILFTSGYTNDAIAHQGVLDPGVAFLQKPYNLNDLLAKVREVLDPGPWIKP